MRVPASRCMVLTTVLLTAALASPVGARAAGEASGAEQESCVRCHSDPDFLVTHPKLYEYFRDWQRSIHGEEGVTCFDCHGGDPEATTADAAHAEFSGKNEKGSAVSFSRVHETCGGCHDEILEAYTRSKHYRKLVADKKGERHGATCVTCHNAMNTLTLDVTTVERACARCHNEESGIDPKIPGQARAALNKFLSIDRFHRYIAARMDPEQSAAFFRAVDDRVAALSVLWHTFDLERIHGETQAVLDEMRSKRDEVRARRSEAPH